MSTIAGPVVCAVIGRTRHKMLQAEIEEAVKQGARLIEVRLDFLTRPDYKRILDKRACPMIATLRRQSDGGRWNSPEEPRRVLMRQAIVAGFDYIDLELDVIDRIPRYGATKRIVSYHNLQQIPENLEQIYEQMCGKDADIVKIVAAAQKPSDNIRILALLKNPPKPTIAFCTGDLGTCSRVLGLRMGMPFTYGAFNRERQIAPGILAFSDLQKLYRVERINAETKVYGVIGDPVGHTLSPLVHNGAFSELGVNAIYLPFRVPRGELEPFLTSFRSVPVEGYSVTLPHKEAAAKHAQAKDELVSVMGSANTLLATESDFRAANTDAQAAVDSLRAHLPIGADGQPGTLSSRNVLLLGAGGAARAVAFALHREGVPVTIANRTVERGQKLAEDVGCKFVEWSARHGVDCDTIINCTSVGMHPNLDESPIHHSFLRPDLMVFDTVYTPETTMLIREAQTRGCHVLTGVDMFVRQAGLQFQLFTGQTAPLELMASLVRRAISPVRLHEDQEPHAAPRERNQPRALNRRLVFLIGYRGAGKSAAARELAELLGWIWVDADALLEERAGRTIRQIFDEQGETAFRDQESALLEELSALQDHVIATGGGVVHREANREMLQRGAVVWLKAPAADLWQRLQGDRSTVDRRPDLAEGGIAEIERLLHIRTPLYEACKDFAVDTSQRTPEEIADVIAHWLSEPA